MNREKKYIKTMNVRWTDAEFDELMEEAYLLRKPVSVYVREIVQQRSLDNIYRK